LIADFSPKFSGSIWAIFQMEEASLWRNIFFVIGFILGIKDIFPLVRSRLITLDLDTPV
jgi:hypothetical protein